MSLAVISTHPIQYQAPIYRALQAECGIPVNAIYGSDFSITGYRDREFGADFAWDTDLLSGYDSVFLSRASSGGANDPEKVTSRGLGETLRQLAPKALLITGYNTRFHRAALYEAWRGRYPVIFRGETTDHAKERNFAQSWIRDQILRRAYKGCSKLLYVGQNSYKHFKRLGCPDGKLIFSPYCVDKGLFNLDDGAHIKIRSEMRRAFNVSEDQLILLFSGKLSHRKGPDLLLEAVKKLPPETHERILTLFLGDGEMRACLEKIAKNKPATKVIFAGFKNQTKIGAYYHAADLLILPSRHSETWGLVVNEALHHGLPCVVSETVGSAPDLIEPNVTGLIFKNGSVSDLTAAIENGLKLTIDPKTRQRCMTKIGDYTVNKAAEGIAKAYNLIKGKYS